MRTSTSAINYFVMAECVGSYEVTIEASREKGLSWGGEELELEGEG